MDALELKSILQDELPDCQVRVEGEGSNYSLTVVGDRFEGLGRVRRQQEVYAALGSLISDGKIHAVSILAQTPEEAAQTSRFNISS